MPNIIHSTSSHCKPQIPTSQSIYKEIVRQYRACKPLQRKFLRNKVVQKYQQHIKNIHKNQQVQERFQKGQEQVLSKQKISISQTKKLIQNKQQMASLNKKIQLSNKSKKIRDQLRKWEKIVKDQKKYYSYNIENSLKKINQLESRFFTTNERKKLFLNQISEGIKNRNSYQSFNIPCQPKLVSPKFIKKKKNLNKKIHKALTLNISRISTQNIQTNRKIKQQIDESINLTKMIEKQKKIVNARSSKILLSESKNKSRKDKTKIFQRMRNINQTRIESERQKRDKILNQKYRQMKNERLTNNSVTAMINRNQETNNPQIFLPISSKNHPSYQKIITEKLRSISLIMNKKPR